MNEVNNARLAASAPELMMALADLLDQLERIDITEWHGAEALSLDANYVFAVDQAYAALARSPYYNLEEVTKS